MSTDPGEQNAADDLTALVQRTRQDPRLANVRDVTIDFNQNPVTLTITVRRRWWRTIDVVFIFPDGISTLDVERAIEAAVWGVR